MVKSYKISGQSAAKALQKQGSTTKWKWVLQILKIINLLGLRYSLVPPVMVPVTRGILMLHQYNSKCAVLKFNEFQGLTIC